MSDFIDNKVLSSLTKFHGKKFYKDEVIFYEGDKAYEAYMIISGSVHIIATWYTNHTGDLNLESTPKTHTLGILSKGDIFGEMALFEDRARSAKAVAIEDTEVIVFTKESLLGNIERYPQLGIRIIRIMSERLRLTDEKLKSVINHNDYLKYIIEAQSQIYKK